MFILLVAELVIATIFMLLADKFPILATINRFFFQQIFITLFLFNSFNIAFSAGLHFKYATAENTRLYIPSTITAVLGIVVYLIALIMLQSANENGFG